MLALSTARGGACRRAAPRRRTLPTVLASVGTLVALFIGGAAPAQATATRPVPAPQITGASWSPAQVLAGGGKVTLRVHVRNAKTCWFKGVPGIVVPSGDLDCAGGTAKIVAVVSANDSIAAAQLQVTAFAAGRSGSDVSTTFSLAEAALTPLKVVTQSLVGAGVGRRYVTKLVAQGGRPPYSWHLASGAFPPGLALSPRGELSGVPTVPGTTTLSLEVVDSAKPTPLNASASVSLQVAPAPLRLTTRSLPGGATESLYNAQFEASGGVAPYSWKWLSGQLPPGLTLSPTGQLSGTPTGGGTYRFQVQVTDSASSPQVTSARYSIVVVTPPLSIGSRSLPGATVESAFSVQLLANGGVPPYTWSVRSGLLPSGITLSNTGQLAGTPTMAGVYPVNIKVTDSSANPLTTHILYRLVVAAIPLSITTRSLPGGTVGSPYGMPIPAAGPGEPSYGMAMAATGGTTPYFWTTAAGALPGGVLLSPTGVLWGTPVRPGTYHFGIKATDSSPQPLSTTTSYTLVIAPVSLLVATTGLPAASLDNPYAAALATSGGTAPYKWAIISGHLPAGIVMSPAGYMTGITKSPGTFTVTVRVTDSSPTPETATTSLTLLVGGGAANWSGYVQTGSYTGVTGTFLVPTEIGPAQSESTCHSEATPPDACAAVSQWVGLDGTTGHNLIQAGVTEADVNGTTVVYPWWEILPEANTPITMTVSGGDKITVSIFKATGDVWAITFDDDTTGLSFRTEQAYEGKGGTADFIVEAPTDRTTKPPSIYPLAAYAAPTSGPSAQPPTAGQVVDNPVIFSNLQTVGRTVSSAALVLVQEGVQASTPSIETPTGFAVAYGSVAPSPPQ